MHDTNSQQFETLGLGFGARQAFVNWDQKLGWNKGWQSKTISEAHQNQTVANATDSCTVNNQTAANYRQLTN
jgi:hypothetical protein